jgi:RNA polymerase sigma factor (sigma-70 family)
MGANQEQTRAMLRLTIDRFLSGESKQYNIIRRKITQYVYHQPRHARIDPNDIVSDTLRILYENLRAGAFRGDSLSAFSAYTYSIVRFGIWKAWNGLKRELPSSELPEVPGPDEELHHEQRALVGKILGALDENCRKLLSLKFFKGWLNQEIADELGKTHGAVRTAITRCLQKASRLCKVEEYL